MAKWIFIMAAVILSACNKSEEHVILESPDSAMEVKFSVNNEGIVQYEVSYKDSLVLEPSRLGVVRKDESFATGMKLVDVGKAELVADSYEMHVGKQKQINYQANKYVVSLSNSNQVQLDIIFQVSNDGVAFRYFFPGSGDDIKYIEEELTSFNFNDKTKAWLQPCSNAKTSWARCNPSYEENYLMDIPVGTPSPIEAGWVYPALFKTDNAWVVLSESGLANNYCATRLKQNSEGGEYKIGFPQKEEVCHNGELKPQSKLPWYSPWRIISVGNLKTVMESTLGTDVASKAIDGDFSWVKPGRASWSWVILKDDATIYPVQKRFIDYAAKMGWEYCLIDGFWDTQIGYDKIKELVEYADTKNVGILLWYNSSGDWNDTPLTPKHLMLTHESRMKEFKRIKEMGVKGTKIDFFGGDGQSVIQYYHEILKDAAEVGLMVNFHGCTLPRGWQRTYPNLLSMEAIKGMEFITFEQGNADRALTHCAMLPFTRNIFDPMDFTPVCFSEIPNIERRSSNGFELALSVLFTSGIQHYAETDSGMEKVPEYVKNAMKNIPVVWDETVFVDGYPGKYVVIARRSNDTWYIAGINAEDKIIELNLNLDFLEGRDGILITDGVDNRSFSKNEIHISKGYTPITVDTHGGFLLQIKR